MTRASWLTAFVMVVAISNTDSASAQVKTLIMPGEVIEGHAEFEAECETCHAAFERSRQRALCLDCHEDVASDIESEQGFHGRDRQASRRACFGCHTDHEGRDADIVPLDRSAFNHDVTDFPLIGKHAESQCDSCHEPDIKFRETPQDCYSCHIDDNVHEESMGTDCGDCHTPKAWLDVQFDHDTTGFALIGFHEQAECLGCHEDQTFQDTPTTCYSCHASNDAHDGKSGQECESCHSPTGWEDTSFNHARDTRFELDGSHAELSCGDCHSDDPFTDQLDMACASCHVEDDNHGGHLGTACETCHVSSGWEFVQFDHNTDTAHEIHGAHEELECVDCHIEPVFDVALQSGCNSCHAEDDPHAGTQGDECADCHNESSWPDDVFFDHGLTRFPLLGAHTDTECTACHESHVFRDASSACADCHHDDDPHNGRFTQDCASCHNPVDWLQWRFDHNRQTSFMLDGAHTDVACESCHRQSLAVQTTFGQRCGDCHRADDIHDGEFGFDCGRCHTADSFTDVRSIQ
jgi:hypothetical protein